MNPPKMDTRDRQQILDEIIKLAGLYTPEWNVTSAEPDAGYALADIYSKMMEDTINRLNRMPFKHYMYFLNLLGVKTLPGRSAAGYITVETTLNSPGVYIKRGTQLYGDGAQEKIIYETEDDLFAVDNRLSVVYCTNGMQKIVRPYIAENPEPFYLFDFINYRNIQKYQIALAHQYIFNISSPTIIIVEIVNKENTYTETEIAAKLCEQAIWYFQSQDGENLQVSHVSHTANKIYLTVEGSVPETKYNGILDKWLICTAREEQQFAEIQFTDIRISASGKDILPDFVIYNDLELGKTDFTPFGDQFSIYDDFYLSCEEVFSKKGSLITIEIDLEYIENQIQSDYLDSYINLKHIMPNRAFEEDQAPLITIEHLSWEYWNGNGWSRLFINDDYERIFKGGQNKKIHISFICPEDFEFIFIGAHKNLWIRARIIKLANAFRPNGIYVVPLIKYIRLSYFYKNESRPIERIIYAEDLKYNILDCNGKEEQLIYFKKNRKEPVAYLGFENEISSGPIKIFFQKDGHGPETAPSLKFEYFSEGRWQELKLLDETNRFKNSGLITFVASKKFTKTTLFGSEYYWLRMVNTDRQYDIQSQIPPKICAVYFNTVKIKQVETMNPEYFSIEPNQRNKTCQLLGSNLVQTEVWVNECGFVSDEERKELSAKGFVREIYNPDGLFRELWIRWKETDEFLNSESNSRHYRLDPFNGVVSFGNGVKGKIPPHHSDAASIMVTYAVSKGESGNLPCGGIRGFAESVPFIAKVENLEGILGGCDKETLDEALHRSSNIIKNRNRAVSLEDVEKIVKSIDRNIISVKCICHMNEAGVPNPGNIVLAILPKSYNENYDYFSTIQKTVEEHLNRLAPAIVSFGGKIKIIECMYIEISLMVEAVVGSYSDYQSVYILLEEKLNQFLNPITGNFQAKGFGIGNVPSREQIYNYIKTAPKLKYIENMNIYAYHIDRGRKKEIDFSTVQAMPFAVPVPGKYEISITVS